MAEPDRANVERLVDHRQHAIERSPKMTIASALKGSLEQLVRSADTALRAPVGDAAWDELARVIRAEHAVLSAILGVEAIDGIRGRVVADAECVCASLLTCRNRGTRSAVAAQRHTVKYCQNMRSEIEKLTFALQELKSPGLENAAFGR